MAYNLAFIIEPTANPAVFNLIDSSTGSDPDLVSKTVYLYQDSGVLLTDPINWPIGQSTLSIDVLTQDVALNVSVTAVSSNPLAPPSTYTYSLLYAFVKYGQDFSYSLTQYQQSNPSVVQTASWYTNKITIMCEILSAQDAINNASDIVGAQQSIVAYQFLITNSNYYFSALT